MSLINLAKTGTLLAGGIVVGLFSTYTSQATDITNRINSMKNHVVNIQESINQSNNELPQLEGRKEQLTMQINDLTVFKESKIKLQNTLQQEKTDVENKLNAAEAKLGKLKEDVNGDAKIKLDQVNGQIKQANKDQGDILKTVNEAVKAVTPSGK